VTIRVDSRQLSLGSTAIRYTVRRSSRRRKTIEIAVDPCQGLVVAAPWSATDDEVANILRRRAAWILRRFERLGDGEAISAPREWVSGEAVLYLGRNYRLRITDAADASDPSVRLTGGWLEVSVPGRTRQATASAVHRWYRQRAAQKLAERVAFFAPKVGVHARRVLIRSQRRRWASCGPDGVLRFNWRLILAPLSLIDYVVVHELCHLRHPGHDGPFWRCVAAVLPDYQTRREALRRAGPAFEVR
jgi:predicted metal-dependent hydrolase